MIIFIINIFLFKDSLFFILIFINNLIFIFSFDVFFLFSVLYNKTLNTYILDTFRIINFLNFKINIKNLTKKKKNKIIKKN